MKKTRLICHILIISLYISRFAFAHIDLDGDSTDWNAYPALIEAPDNLEDMFPADFGAAVTDIVDLKTIKATIIDNVLFIYLEFWGGPAWPNNAYENIHDGEIYYESRGYYSLLIDIDNDMTTGWRTDWYEAHLSPLGHFISQGFSYNAIGAEILLEWHSRTNDGWRVEREGANPVRNLDYWASDCEEYNGNTDLGSHYEIFNMSIPDPDSAKMMQWHGVLNINSSDDSLLVADTQSFYKVGHGWGQRFLEFGVELTPLQTYYKHKDGRTILMPGDTINICGMVESPIDDWGVEMTTGGGLIIDQSVGVVDNAINIEIEQFVLKQNYPNPFNPTTTIAYALPKARQVRITIFDILGREVRMLVNATQQAGQYKILWDGTNEKNMPVVAGVYFYKMEAGEFTQVKKLLFLG